jgi:hypothetical protein
MKNVRVKPRNDAFLSEGTLFPDKTEKIQISFFDDVDITQENTDAETWAFLNRPESEQYMRLEEWKELFATREGTDYYEKYFAAREAMINAMPLPFTDGSQEV